MIDHIFNLFGGKKSAKNADNLDELVGLILHLRTSRNSKKEYNLNCPARTVKQAYQIS
jgi:hypothetical protein